MTFVRRLAALAAFAITMLLLAAPASAQATRTWVSGTGADSNTCLRNAPCQTFAGAIGKTVAGGEIDCLDPGGFGALTITKSITIDCDTAGGLGGVLVSGTNGFVVAAGTQVQLIGLNINGLGTGLNGVLVNGNNVSVTIQNCLIYSFQAASSTTGAGVLVTGTSSRVLIQDSSIRQNNAGVVNAPSSGSASILINHVAFDNNTTTAITSPPALNDNLVVQTGGYVVLSNSTLTGSAPSVSNGGTVLSYGNNVIKGPITGTAITPMPLQ
jgi:hypothetical protein